MKHQRKKMLEKQKLLKIKKNNVSNGSIVSIKIENNGKNYDLQKNSDVQSNNSSIFDDNPHKGDEEFQNEDLYRDKSKKNDVFMLREVTKIYEDGKMACNKISFNLFRNEIFALLGRNGAGKTSLINGNL